MLPCSDACERNKQPILEVLRGYFADRSHVLEIASGTGQHAVYFAANLRHLVWHPTERSIHLEDLAARVDAAALRNLTQPAELDVAQPDWPLAEFDSVFSANTLHILSWTKVTIMFRRMASFLKPGGIVAIYGPFLYENRATAPSNIAFDRSLKERDAESGLRHFEAVAALAAQVDLTLAADNELPANNQLLVFKKETPREA